MTVLFVGANPIVRLFDAGAVSAFASVWIADWTVKGPGTALVLWHRGSVRVLGEDAELARWLERDFTRHFPEVAGLDWPESTVEIVPVRVRAGLDSLEVEAGDVEVSAGDVLDRRTFATDAFELDGVAHGLSLVLAPVATGRIAVGGTGLPGEVVVEGTPERPSSSAFLTAGEVWTR
ncbi:hypothetical protein [Phytomonospora endophytica]|uniref:Uncharacterized protein n=1 Tax=Phytomonospora endophytica TaxID=714109 RepID=A0A841FD32_9ACTN|nr:hypothetical protein [Phytomonospora endophytica]MBB6035191.1 hypothetical protein [Phytomonospora endophytica]GIG64060.1 hypothetical protein Pen01_03550 [Phytomonospora endophytica]